MFLISANGSETVARGRCLMDISDDLKLTNVVFRGGALYGQKKALWKLGGIIGHLGIEIPI